MLNINFVWMFSLAAELLMESEEAETENEFVKELFEDNMVLIPTDDFLKAGELISEQSPKILKHILGDIKFKDLKIVSIELLGKSVNLSKEFADGK